MFEFPDHFVLGNADTWPTWLFPVFGGVIFAGLEILAIIVPALFYSWEHIPIRGKHLDVLSSTDKFYVFLNKVFTCMFVYHFIKYTTKSATIEWDINKMTLMNTIPSFVAFYFFYDFFYMWFHWLLHNRYLYRFIHKHHHR